VKPHPKKTPARRAPPKKTPKLWQRLIAGKRIGSWYVTVAGERINLNTKDATLALERRKEAVRGKREFSDDAEGAAGDTIAALDARPFPMLLPAPTPDPTSPQPPPPTPIPVIEPEPIPQEPRTDAGDWTADANDAATMGSPVSNGAAEEPPSAEELAGLAVDLELWGAELYAKQTEWDRFVAPQLPAESKAELAKPWQKLIEYSGTAVMLPPWVTGLLIPGVTIVISTISLAKGFALAAREQKRAAGGGDAQQPEAPQPAALS